MKSRKVCLKYYLIIFSILFSITNYAFGQNFEFIPSGGYQFSGNIKTDEGKINFKDGSSFGLAFDIWVQKDMMAEFWYSKNKSSLEFTSSDDKQKSIKFDMDMDYFHAGAIYHPDRGLFRPFATITLGVTRFNSKNENYSDNWEFSIGIGAGAKYFFTDNIGLRLQGRFLIPVYLTDTTLYCSNGKCFISLNAGTVLFQTEFSIGLIAAF